MDQTLQKQPVDVRLVASFFLAKDEVRQCPDVTQMKLHKLLYFAQANFLAATGSPLFGSRIRAYEHGPVIEEILAEYRRFGRSIIVVADDAIAHNAQEDSEELPVAIADFLEDVWRKFFLFSASQLRNMSHDDTPWQQSFHREARSVMVEAEIADFYRTEAPLSHRVFAPFVSGITTEDLLALEQPISAETHAFWASNA